MNSSIDQQFIEFVVKSLVNNPDDVQVARTIDEKGVLLELTVNPEDLGRVIGKRGATAQSLRTLLRALGTKNEARYNLKIIDNGEPRPPRDDYNDNHQTNDQPVATPAAKSADSDDEITEPAANTYAAQKSDHSDAISKTRAELEDLDDLDI